MKSFPAPWLDDAAAVGRSWIREAGRNEATLPLSVLTSPGHLPSLLHAHRAGLDGGACNRAAASVWSKHLMAALLPGPMLAALAGTVPAADPVVILDRGLPKATLPAVPAAVRAMDPAAAAAWVTGPLASAIGALAAASGLAPRVFWSNAATMLAYLFEKWGDLPEAAERSAILREALFEAPRLAPAGTPNPLLGQISYVATPVPAYPTVRRRRICCLRDRLGQPLCASCPKIGPEERDRLLAAAG